MSMGGGIVWGEEKSYTPCLFATCKVYKSSPRTLFEMTMGVLDIKKSL